MDSNSVTKSLSSTSHSLGSSVTADATATAAVEGDGPSSYAMSQEEEEVCGRAGGGDEDSGVSLSAKSEGEACGDAMEVVERASVQEEEGEGRREAEGQATTTPSEAVAPPTKLQRFYFESDTLALKNNPE